MLESEVAEQTLYDLPYTRFRAAVLLSRLREYSVVICSAVNCCVMITLEEKLNQSGIWSFRESLPNSKCRTNTTLQTYLANAMNQPLPNTFSQGPAPAISASIFFVSPTQSLPIPDTSSRHLLHVPPEWLTVTSVALSRVWKSGSKLNDKRQRHRQSGLLQLGQTARLLNANLTLIIFLWRWKNRECEKRIEIEEEAKEIYTLSKKIVQFIHSEM
jgi:hypothetical protein